MTDTVDKVIIEYQSVNFDKTNSDIKNFSGSLDGLTEVSFKNEKSTTSLDGKFAALERRFQTTAAQAAQLEKIQKQVNDAVSQNPALQDRANAVLAAAEVRYSTTGKAVNELSNAHRGMDAQGQAALHSIRSMGEQLALGIPPTQALTGQLNHLTFAASGEGGLVGAFKQVASTLGGALAGFLTVGTVIGGAAVVIGAGALYIASNWSDAQKEIDRSLIGIGRRTGTTAADINKFVADNASATGLSVDQARAAAIEFTKTGNITVSGLEGVGEAIHGYSILTGEDATKATKTFSDALSGDLVKAAEKFDGTYGFLNSTTREYIRTLELQGDRSKAMQVILDGMVKDNQRAADSVGTLSWAWAAFGNVLSNIKNGPTATPQDELAALRSRQAELQAQQDRLRESDPALRRGADPTRGLGGAQFGGGRLTAEIDDLQKKIDAVRTDGIVKQLNGMSKAGDAAVRSMIPQIEQIDNLEKKLHALQDAQNMPGVFPKLDGGVYDAATVAVQNQLAVLRESQVVAENYNQRVAEISKSWGNVSQSTALQLQASKNNLPVLQAITGQQKMAAQYAADYANALDKGKSPADAMALAADRLANSQAIATAQVQAQTEALNAQTRSINQNLGLDNERKGVAEAFNNALLSGASYLDAQAAAAARLNNNIAQAANSAAALAANSKGYNPNSQTADMTQPGWGGSIATPGAKGGSVPVMGQIEVDAYNRQYGPGGWIVTGVSINQGSGGHVNAIVAANDQGLQYKYSQQLLATGLQGLDPVTYAKVQAGTGKIPNAQAIVDQFLTGNYARDPNSQKAAADFLSKYLDTSAAATTAASTAIDTLTSAVNTNTSAVQANTAFLSPFYSQKGDQLLGYRGYTASTYTNQGLIPAQGWNLPGDPNSNATAVASIVNSAITAMLPALQHGAGVNGTVTGLGIPGVYAFADGGIMTAHGKLPLRNYATGGIANSPQLAMFGEGSTPEAFIPLPNGGGSIPVTIKVSGNDNAKRQININAPLIYFASQPTKDEVRETAMQAAGRMRAMLSR